MSPIVFFVGILLGLAGPFEGSFETAASLTPLAQTVDPADPLENPRAVQDRVETGSPDETVLSKRKNIVIASLIASVALIVLVSFAWAARSGRQNKPAAGKRPIPPSGG